MSGVDLRGLKIAVKGFGDLLNPKLLPDVEGEAENKALWESLGEVSASLERFGVVGLCVD